MSISWSKDKLAEVVGGKVKSSSSSIIFEGLEFDSREIRGGELFIALAGQNSHGHEFVNTALERGASVCLVEDESFLNHPEHAERFIFVENSLKAFWDLAKHYRQELGLPILAITGSMGKTTVKEMTAQLLLTQENGAYSKKSFNNHVGVPYTLCNISKHHKWAVLEVGMNNTGEISNLTKIIQPNFVLITGVAAVHIAHFGNIEAIAKAKCEIPEGLINDGVVVLNADDKLLQDTYKEIWGEKFKVKTFGKSDLSDVKVLKTKPLGLSGIEVEILLAGEKVELKLSTPGEHNAINAAAALCSVLLFYPQADIAELANALKRFVPPLMRLNILPLKGGRQLVDDSYNANPYSMKALLKIAQQEMQLGKKVCLILGDMLELGREAKDRHSELAKQVSELKPEYFIAVGEYADLMSQIVKESGVKSFVAESPESAAHTALKINVDLIMIKASRGVGLDRASKIILDKEGLN